MSFVDLIGKNKLIEAKEFLFNRLDEIAANYLAEEREIIGKNTYVEVAHANQRSLQNLLTELAVVRQATLSLFKSFSEDDLMQIGTASNHPMSVRALGFVIIGHQNHHQRIFEERYL